MWRINEGGRVGRVMSRMIHQGIGIDYQTFSGKGQFINMICIRTENSQQQNVFSLESLSFSKLLQNNIIINSHRVSKKKYSNKKYSVCFCLIINCRRLKSRGSHFECQADFLPTTVSLVLLQFDFICKKIKHFASMCIHL